ncbi:MAG TPA: glycosyltransferase family 2 protein [Candidatus Limnocylindrales bacterium]|jgi:hypothetical protein
MTAPLVSVLVPAWNNGRSITRALDSVLMDPAANIQVVVVDDASTDDTPAVVEAIAARDPRVELVRSAVNGGPSAARNLGLPRLRGEWVTFLDADDRLLPGGLAALLAAATGTDALAVVGQRVWSDGTATWITRLYDQPDITEPGRKSLLRNPGLMFYASATGKLFHRSLIGGLRFDGRVLGDQPWTLRALLRAGDRIEVIGDVVYEWTRPGEGNQFSSITERKRQSAAFAAEAVAVAVDALEQVAGEAGQVLPAPADRHAIAVGYVDRLVRADFAGPVRRALDSRDPALPLLFDALVAFLAAAPREVVADVPAVLGGLVAPAMRHWDRVPGPTRQQVVEIVHARIVDMPGTPGGAYGRLGLLRLGVVRWAVRRLPPGAGRSVVGGLLALGGWLVARLRWMLPAPAPDRRNETLSSSRPPA